MLRKIKSKYIECGPFGVFLSIIRRLPGVKALCVYYVYRFPFSELSDSYLQIENVRSEVMDNDIDIKGLLVLQDKEDIFRERFKMEHFCVMSYFEDEVISYLWAQTGPKHVERRYGLEIKIADNQVFYYDSYTRPDWRKKGLGRFLVNQMALYCIDRFKKSELITIIEIDNLISRTAYEKIGFKKDRLGVFIDLMGKPIQF